MKLKDGREIVEQEIDENNHLVYIVKDDLAPSGEAAVDSQDVEVNKEISQGTHIRKTVTNGH